MHEETWVVVARHTMDTAWLSIDGASVELLGLESELLAREIDVVFDPFRPGEGSSFSRTIRQPIRLLVKQSDAERAREIAREVGLDNQLVDE
jgi:hypothetical protein